MKEQINRNVVAVRIVVPEDPAGVFGDVDVIERAELVDGEAPDDLLAIQLASAIRAIAPPQPLAFAAKLVMQLANADVKRNPLAEDLGLIDAAAKLVEAWEENDARLHAKVQA